MHFLNQRTVYKIQGKMEKNHVRIKTFEGSILLDFLHMSQGT